MSQKCNQITSFVTLSAVTILIGIFHIGKFCFWVPFFKKLLLRNCLVDFVEICNFCARKAIIEAAKRIINSDKVCHSYSDLNFGVTFFGTQCIIYLHCTRSHAERGLWALTALPRVITGLLKFSPDFWSKKNKNPDKEKVQTSKYLRN